ncbi:aminoglycoside phosphotransferase family protein [Actinophytocola sp.]|uniref:aminoglycoside phosphotransferase family protein n=1 Tax=Actinophytocola sp. TaxID=1872138 RepID=UPI003D6A9AB6
MYRLGDDMVVRPPLVRGGAEDVSMEQGWLPHLAPRPPTRIPDVLGAGEPAHGYPWPWSVYRWLVGEHSEARALSEPMPLAEDLAAFVVAMRNITLPAAPKAHRGGPVASLDAETRAAIKELRGIPQEDVDCDAAAAVWDETLRAPGWDGPPVWLRADLLPANVLVDGGRLASVIDFWCVGRGDPACDLFPAWNPLPRDARDVFREALAVDDATWIRGRGGRCRGRSSRCRTTGGPTPRWRTAPGR